LFRLRFWFAVALFLRLFGGLVNPCRAAGGPTLVLFAMVLFGERRRRRGADRPSYGVGATRAGAAK